MSKPECYTVAERLLNAGGYVCQGQRILRATAEYRLDSDSLATIRGRAGATSDKDDDGSKIATDTQSGEKVVERQGKLLSGSALDYGVAFTPTCLAPEHSRFARVLPRSRLERTINFVLYRILEPLLPPTEDQVDVAQNGHSG
jgi:hypothetical protein